MNIQDFSTEQRIVYLEPPTNFPYLRESTISSRSPCGSPGVKDKRVIAYAEVSPVKTKRVHIGTQGIHFYERRCWWIKESDPYEGGPIEAVNPLSLRAGHPTKPFNGTIEQAEAANALLAPAWNRWNEEIEHTNQAPHRPENPLLFLASHHWAERSFDDWRHPDSGISWSLEEAIHHQMRRVAVGYLSERGWRVRSRVPTVSAGWTDLLELRDPMSKKKAKDWQEAFILQQKRDIVPPDCTL